MEKVLKEVGREIGHSNAMGLGELGGVVDMAPWKFAGWSGLSFQYKQCFIEEGIGSYD